MSIQAYPLQWPAGWKRTGDAYRQHGQFGKRVSNPKTTWRRLEDVTVTEALIRVLAELQRMGIDRDDVVISTNVPTRLDGLPRSGAKAPADPGAAVYWRDGGANRCIAVDRYLKVEDNLCAIAATLDAMRAIERHGGAAILERAFTGFTALPAPGHGAPRDWWEVLGVDRATVTREGCKQAYRRLASQFHPDKPGGSHAAMAELNAAQEQALKEVFA